MVEEGVDVGVVDGEEEVKGVVVGHRNLGELWDIVSGYKHIQLAVASTTASCLHIPVWQNTKMQYTYILEDGCVVIIISMMDHLCGQMLMFQLVRGSQRELVKNGWSLITVYKSSVFKDKDSTYTNHQCSKTINQYDYHLITVASGLPVIVPSQSKTIPLRSELNQAGGRPRI